MMERIVGIVMVVSLIVGCGQPMDKEKVEKQRTPESTVAVEMGSEQDPDLSSESVGRDRELVYAIPGDPLVLDPHIMTDMQSYIVTYLQFEALIDVDQNLNYVPRIASSWTIAEDGLTITFKLRPGVRWHDGKAVTAEDVLFSYERITDPVRGGIRFRGTFDEVRSVSIRDASTIEVVYKRPYAPAMQSWSQLSILPRHHYEGKKSGEMDMAPVGSGPYRFVEWKKGHYIRLAANQDYWYGQPPIAGLLFRVLPSATIAYNSLLRGVVDGLEVTNAQWSKHLANTAVASHYEMYRFPTLNFYVIAWNADGSNPFFTNAEVRKAMTLATDRHALIQKLLLGLAEHCTGPFSPYSWAYDRTIKPLDFDLAKAGEILNSQGWLDSDRDGIRDRDGQQFTFSLLITANNAQVEQIATMLQYNFEMLGIAVNIVRVDNAGYIDRIMKRQYQACITALSVSIDPDNYVLLHSSQKKDGFNLAGYVNPEVDRLLEEARNTFNREQRSNLYHQIHRHVYNDQPYTFLFTKPGLNIFSKRVKGISSNPLSPFLYFPGILDWTIQPDTPEVSR